jgi:hypothetical protein
MYILYVNICALCNMIKNNIVHKTLTTKSNAVEKKKIEKGILFLS